MTVIVLSPGREAGDMALVSALQAGLGEVRVARDHADADAALGAHPRAVLLLDLRATPDDAHADVGRLRAAHPSVLTCALIGAGGEPPGRCDSVFAEPLFLEDVVRWCTRALEAPMAKGLVEDLAAGLCHEIGNPLTSLFLQLELLRTDEDIASVREHLQLIEESARRIQTVVRDVAEAAEHQPVSAAPADLCDLLERALDRLASRDEALAERVDLTCRSARPALDQDLVAGALADVWEYLLRAGEGDEPLVIEAGPRQDQVLISARAAVPRLPADAAGRLFTPLWARQALGLSAGLSLTSARNAFLRHRGDLVARQLPDGALLLEGRLPLDSQATFEFPA